MNKWIFLLGTFICLQVLVGCSTNISVSELATIPKDGEAINGIPFRVKERYKVSLYKLEDGKYMKLDTKDNVATLSNQDHLYVLKLSGSPLADGGFEFDMNTDNTFSRIKITSKNKTPDLITALGKSKKDIADANAASDKAKTDSQKADEASTVSEEDARLAALDAKQAALLATAELEALPPDASTLDRTKAEQKLSRARVLANQKARRAGLALPFSDAGT